MEFDVLGDQEEGPTLDLDHERFAYAGNFVMSTTGKSVVRNDGVLVGAVAFNEDRTDAKTVRLRYVTVREDRRGEGIGPRLLRFTADRLTDQGYETVEIAVNNPIAYRACYRAGFVWTGEESGIAELLLGYAPSTDPDHERYRDGLELFGERELPDEHRAILDTKEPPARITEPTSRTDQ